MFLPIFHAGRRLRVPRYGAMLEFMNFTFLLITFVICLSSEQLLSILSRDLANWFTLDADRARVHPTEIVFVTFAVAFILEEYTAQKEHGWTGMHPHLILYVMLSDNATSSLFCKRTSNLSELTRKTLMADLLIDVERV